MPSKITLEKMKSYVIVARFHLGRILLVLKNGKDLQKRPGAANLVEMT
jgi:hypothetical protein